MGDHISPHFSWSEAQCHDGTAVPAIHQYQAIRLAETYLEPIRHAAGDRPIIVISWYRSKAWNRRVGGARQSRHMSASAADIRIQGMTALDLHDLILDLMLAGSIPYGGLGLYDSFVHVDSRGYLARWQSHHPKES